MFVLSMAMLLIVSALVIAYALGGIPGLVQRDRLSGVFAPAYDAAGENLYFIHRETRGWSVGPGWEHFTPPARVRASRDVFSLRRLDPASGDVEVLESWSPSPLVGRTISTYRNRIFTPISARIRVGDEGVEYSVRMSVPRQPTSELYRLMGTWSESSTTRGSWEEGHAEVSGSGETPLNGRWEVMVVPGPGGYPSAIVAFDEAIDEIRVLVETPAFARSHPEGVSSEWLRERSRRADIERIETLRSTREALLERFRREGMTEMEASLATTRELQRLGFYPKPTTIVARRLAIDEVPLGSLPNFTIPFGEMQSGVFPDIERALADPGVEVEKSMGSYIIHRDYENSARLNDYLGDGGQVFYVTYEGGTYQLTVEKPAP